MTTTEDHVIIVTGAGGGLGGAMARALIGAGRRVVALDIQRGITGLRALTEFAAAGGASDRLFVKTVDVRSEEECRGAVEATLQRFGAIHGLVNNAGVAPRWAADGNGPHFLDVTPADWRFGIETNLTGPFLLALAATPPIVKSGWGRIVNVTTSLATMIKPGMTPYGASKAGLEAASAIWAKDLAGTGVSVNVLVPGGPADTPILSERLGRDRSKLIPPEVMQAPIVWLTSHASDGTTGCRFVANDWDLNAPLERNLENAKSPVAWPE
jgi:NAD(P)-dependent dehydrogenase (short-subunit alcohol dehydrogenase family)